MTVASDEESLVPSLHVGTLGGYVFSDLVPSSSSKSTVRQPPWTKKMRDIREQFDLDKDLGGLAIARIWGLASYHGLVAAVVTAHPGDEVVYATTMKESCTIIFSSGNLAKEEFGDPMLPTTILDGSPCHLRRRREAVIEFVLSHESESDDINHNTWSQRIAYSAACCAILESGNEKLNSLALRVLERLAVVTGADLTEEMDKCSAGPKPIPISPKSPAQLGGPGGSIFEKCDICDAGISWFSAREAQCETGHLFGKYCVTANAYA